MRMRSIVLAGLLLMTSLAYGQTYRVGLCPGPLNAYARLVKDIEGMSATKEDAALKQIRGFLYTWDTTARLKRFVVEIRRPDARKVWVWRRTGNAAPPVLASLASLESTAGRGGGMRTDARPGDNQRCFFQDTTVVVDTLFIRRGEFADAPRLTIGGKSYTLPVSNGRWLLSSQTLPGVTPGQYQTATVQLGDGPVTSFTLYLLSDDERRQLTESTRNWLADEPVACSELTNRLIDYLAQNWGGNYCATPALYLNAQRSALQQLIGREHLTCTP